MAKGERAFWSSLPGALTGLAGILTAGFGLVGLAVSQGWVGDGGTGSEVARISAEPDELTLATLAGETAKTVTVTNAGTQPVTVTAEIVGDDGASFRADDADCTRSAIPPEATCEVEVTFDAGVGIYEATLEVSAEDEEQVQEVELRGTSGNPLG